ncbi:MAG TPA: hypothetical protein VLQ78_10065 [Ornithinibacter sp.]|nr:hypothetical protein [Ornithinibacter sp.]
MDTKVRQQPLEQLLGLFVQVLRPDDDEGPPVGAETGSPGLVVLPLLVRVVPPTVVLDGRPHAFVAQVDAEPDLAVGIVDADVDLRLRQAGQHHEQAEGGLGHRVDAVTHQSSSPKDLVTTLTLHASA